ncbi:MAG TPA: pyridoxamine 5'-phosphate oxidase family protein [Actinomycetota bacterium]|nr:pyridoxamine 5'-phosphate oxidase family protein [Actinomycetota bacterium]
MSEPLGDRLPPEILRAFDGEDLERKVGPALLLVTTDEDGTPRPCMLSAGEVLAPDDRRLRVALWPGTRTARNLSRGSRVLLCFVAPGAVLYVKGTARPLGPSASPPLERFEVAVEAVESDRHAGMPVTQGIAFAVEGRDVARVVEAWRRQLAALRDG